MAGVGALGVAAGAVAFVAGAGTSSATVTTLGTFTTPGAHTWTVPTGVTSVTFDVYGASGGSVLGSNHGIVTVVSAGGAGGEAKGKFAVHAGEVFDIIVGGQGGAAHYGIGVGSGGVNGGGVGSLLTPYGGGGGGASDVRIGGRGNPCASSIGCGSGDRIIVGGGGGGGSANGTNGQPGGGLVGGGGSDGATQEQGGSCNPYPGLFGLGASPGTTVTAGNGGGGGGWFGGGCFAAAGGGSGFISPLSKSGSFPGGTQQGDGKVIITTG